MELNIEGDIYPAIMQDLQFHPVNEMLMHVDFLQLDENREVKMEIPVRLVGTSPGVLAGGKLVTKLRKVKVKALPANLPDYLDVDISDLELGKSVKAGKIKAEGVTVLVNPSAPVATVTITRALRQAENANR